MTIKEIQTMDIDELIDAFIAAYDVWLLDARETPTGPKFEKMVKARRKLLAEQKAHWAADGRTAEPPAVGVDAGEGGV